MLLILHGNTAAGSSRRCGVGDAAKQAPSCPAGHPGHQALSARLAGVPRKQPLLTDLVTKHISAAPLQVFRES